MQRMTTEAALRLLRGAYAEARAADRRGDIVAHQEARRAVTEINGQIAPHGRALTPSGRLAAPNVARALWIDATRTAGGGL